MLVLSFSNRPDDSRRIYTIRLALTLSQLKILTVSRIREISINTFQLKYIHF